MGSAPQVKKTFAAAMAAAGWVPMSELDRGILEIHIMAIKALSVIKQV